jgi:hypothetical protein
VTLRMGESGASGAVRLQTVCNRPTRRGGE